ncbi:uncharacterized protein [Dermacentor albipictus]|uniref:uncharacterized protein isoform X1 n=1 Tax=Dermacentor albipictus TaxID=60249 RepID=UPI0038FD2E60
MSLDCTSSTSIYTGDTHRNANHSFLRPLLRLHGHVISMSSMMRGCLTCLLLFTFAALTLASFYEEDREVTDDGVMNPAARGDETVMSAPQDPAKDDQKEGRSFEDHPSPRFPLRRRGKLGRTCKGRGCSSALPVH